MNAFHFDMHQKHQIYWFLSELNVDYYPDGIGCLASISSCLLLAKEGNIFLLACCIGHEDSVGLSVCKVHISATRWRFYS
jgi:hypothetical protein